MCLKAKQQTVMQAVQLIAAARRRQAQQLQDAAHAHPQDSQAGAQPQPGQKPQQATAHAPPHHPPAGVQHQGDHQAMSMYVPPQDPHQLEVWEAAHGYAQLRKEVAAGTVLANDVPKERPRQGTQRH